MLHSAYFSTVSNSKEAAGLFGSMNSLVKGISTGPNKYATSITKKDINTIIADLEKTGLYQGIEVKETYKGFKVKIGKCLFAGGEDGVHKQLKPVDVPCPIAYSIAQFIDPKNPNEKIYLQPSTYDEEGTSTSIEVLSLEEYTEKMQNLTKMIKLEKEIETATKE